MEVVFTVDGGKEYLVSTVLEFISLDMPTSELDFSGLHINLLYLMNKKELPMTDPYDIKGIGIDGFNRQIVKIILLHIINAKSRASAIKSITMTINFDTTLYEYVSQNNLDYLSFIDEILITHKSIKEILLLRSRY